MAVCAHSKSLPALNADSIKAIIKPRMDPAQFDAWIAPLAVSVDGKVLNLVAANQFSCDFIRATHLHVLSGVASELGLDAQLHIGRPAQTINPKPINDNAPKKEFVADKSRDVEYVARNADFDSFICSDENVFALNACKKVAAGTVSFSPLFIYGPEGCGKTLLAECLNESARGRTLMMTGPQFVSEFARAITERSIFAFKDFMRKCDTFILDDVNALCGKRATSEEFITLIIDLAKSGRNVVLFANAAPAALSGFDRRAQSVLASGLVADLTPPNKSVRKNMLSRAGVGADVADGLATRIDGNGHLVAGIAKKITAWREMMGAEITIDAAEKLLTDSLSKQKTPLSFAREMAAKLGVSYDDVTSTSRVRGIVRARQIMMTALKQTTNLSLSEIGRLLGDRNHATVLYGLAQIEKQKQTDLMLNAEIQQLING